MSWMRVMVNSFKSIFLPGVVTFLDAIDLDWLSALWLAGVGGFSALWSICVPLGVMTEAGRSPTALESAIWGN